MGLWIFLLLLLVVLTWLVMRSVRAGHGKLLAGIILLPAGVVTLLALVAGRDLFHILFVNVLAMLFFSVPAVLVVSLLVLLWRWAR